LQGLSLGDRRGARANAARLLPVIAPVAPARTTERSDLQALEETGATGLEPATSGVTGRFDGHDDGRRWTRNRSIHAALRASRDPLPHGCAKPISDVCCPFAARAACPNVWLTLLLRRGRTVGASVLHSLAATVRRRSVRRRKSVSGDDCSDGSMSARLHNLRDLRGHFQVSSRFACLPQRQWKQTREESLQRERGAGPAALMSPRPPTSGGFVSWSLTTSEASPT
jgi:hypothetical protein